MGIFQNGFAKLFGYELKGSPTAKDKAEELARNEVIEVENDDASGLIDAQYAIASSINIQKNLKEQADLINEYRLMAMHPEVDYAIDDIINASISCDEDSDPISIDLEDLEVTEATKKKILAEFETIISLLDMNNSAYEKFRQWYVDGRSVYHVVIDQDKPKEGIQKLVSLDPRATRKYKEYKKSIDENGVEKIAEVEEYFVYDRTFSGDTTTDGSAQKSMGAALRREQQIRMTIDSVVQVHSGVLAADNSAILSNLEKARKPLNNLKMLEDAVIVYHLVRAPERRLFYIDVGTLQKKSTEEYLQMVMNRHKTKFQYDPTSGKVAGAPHQLSMHEDYYLPVREGGQGTKVETLEGGSWDAIDELTYFLKKLYKALNVPQTRLEQESTINIGGGGSEITRDEWKFNKFVSRLRRRYSALFDELLKRQLILKGITTQEDWEEVIQPSLKYIYASDTYMKDQRDAEIFNDRIATLSAVGDFVGTYFSQDYIFRNVLKFTDEEIDRQKKKIKEEISEGLYPDPIEVKKAEMAAEQGQGQADNMPPPQPMMTPGFGMPEFDDDDQDQGQPPQ